MRLVGLSGYARSGKDEAAKVLVDEYGFKRIAFADKLRDFLYALNPIVKHINAKVQLKTPGGIKNLMLDDKTPSTITLGVRLRDVIDRYGWDGYKETPYSQEIRELLQRLGTEAGRQTLWDSIWIDAALHDLDPNGNYVVTDVRFPNEAEAITQRGGRLVRIIRDGVGPANSHASETSLDDYPFIHGLRNDGSLEDFRENVKVYFAPRY